MVRQRKGKTSRIVRRAKRLVKEVVNRTGQFLEDVMPIIAFRLAVIELILILLVVYARMGM